MTELRDAISVLRNRTELAADADRVEQEISAIWEALAILTDAIEQSHAEPLPADVKV